MKTNIATVMGFIFIIGSFKILFGSELTNFIGVVPFFIGCFWVIFS